MILQNDPLWLGGDRIGESLIPNQSPVSAGSNVHLSSFFCLLELRYRTEMHTHCRSIIENESLPLHGDHFTWDSEVQSPQAASRQSELQ